MNIIDYGKSVSKKTYIHGLQAHPYIPQSDERILRVIEALPPHSRILDLGCGPGRLTMPFAKLNPDKVFVGIDSSPYFVSDQLIRRSHVSHKNVRLYCARFEDLIPCEGGILDPQDPFKAIFMQGVWHHIHGDTRKLWMEKCHNLLIPGGLLIIGDEYIPDGYNNREEALAHLYLHIIGEALRGGFEDLAIEEAKNFIDDISGGGEGAGYADEELLQQVMCVASTVTRMLYEGFRFHGENAINMYISTLVDTIRKRATQLEKEGQMTSFYRGDYKVTMKENVHELTSNGFVPRDAYTFGPIESIGGMGVLVFGKK